jgi:hypothetical protein
MKASQKREKPRRDQRQGFSNCAGNHTGGHRSNHVQYK